MKTQDITTRYRLAMDPNQSIGRANWFWSDYMDVRLTMGGEPTFCISRRFDSMEWNSAADGPHKRKLLHINWQKFIWSLWREWIDPFLDKVNNIPEPLPRWQYGIFRRKDGHPIWRHKELFAPFDQSGHLTVKELYALGDKIFEMRLDQNVMIPAYEDAFYFAWEEYKLPNDKDPLQYKLDDPIERKHLRKYWTTDSLTRKDM